MNELARRGKPGGLLTCSMVRGRRLIRTPLMPTSLSSASLFAATSPSSGETSCPRRLEKPRLIGVGPCFDATEIATGTARSSALHRCHRRPSRIPAFPRGRGRCSCSPSPARAASDFRHSEEGCRSGLAHIAPPSQGPAAPRTPRNAERTDPFERLTHPKPPKGSTWQRRNPGTVNSETRGNRFNYEHGELGNGEPEEPVANQPKTGQREARRKRRTGKRGNGGSE